MRLKHLTLNKLMDTAYFCGIDKTPVSMVIAAPPGAGKTWSASALAETDFVQYLCKPFSPSEHRKIIGGQAARTRLLINDDLSLTSRWNAKEYFGTFCMIIDGEVQYTQWKRVYHFHMHCSTVLCCTSDYYNSNIDDMRAMGLLDRVIPIVLGLSNETRREYQEHERRSHLFDSKPTPRNPEFLEVKSVKTELLLGKDIDPRLLRNLRRMSQYLTNEETTELVDIAHSNGRYEI